MKEHLITEHLDIWSATVTTKSASGRGKNNKLELYGLKKLRELILELAVRGLLVPQSPEDEPASALLKKIAAEKTRLIKVGKVKKQKKLPPISEDEKSFELPNGWEWCRLGNVVTLKSGTTINKEHELDQGEILYLKVGDMNLKGNEYEITTSTRFIDFSEMIKNKLIPENSIIFPKRGGAISTNKKRIIRDSLLVDLNIMAMICPGNLFLEYLYYWFQSFDLWTLNSGTSVPQINNKDIEPILFPLPPLEEQHRIVAKVDEFMALCDQLECEQETSISAHHTLVHTLLAALATAGEQGRFDDAWARIADHFDILFTTERSIDQLKQTILQLAVMGKLVPQHPDDEPASVLLKNIAAEKARLIKAGKIKKQKKLASIGEDEKPFDLPEGWEWCHLGDISSFENGDRSSRYPKSADLVDNGIPFFGAPDIENGELTFSSNLRFITEDKFSKLSNGKLVDRDFIMLLRGTVGKTAQFHKNNNYTTGFINAQMLIIRLCDVSFDKYLRNFFNSDFFKQIIAERKSGAVIQQIPANKIAEIEVPIPPKIEQHRIVAKVDELMALCDRLKERITAARATQRHLADAMTEQAIGS